MELCLGRIPLHGCYGALEYTIDQTESRRIAVSLSNTFVPSLAQALHTSLCVVKAMLGDVLVGAGAWVTYRGKKLWRFCGAHYPHHAASCDISSQHKGV